MNISDEQLIGFADAQGTFYVGVVPTFETVSGWQVIHFFKLTGSSDCMPYLQALKDRVGGYIKEGVRKNTLYVRDKQNIREKLIPFFDGRLISKKDNFEKFKEVVGLVAQREHLKKEGISRILDTAYSMNTQKRILSKEGIVSSYE